MILSTLRERTSSLHERVERTVNLPTRLRSRDDYAALLVRLHGFYAPIESRLAAAVEYGPIGLDFTSRRKAGLLRQDLAAFGHSPVGIDRFPVCGDLPAVAGPAGALGCLYVLEGATLGGRIIRKAVESRHGLGPDSGCAFFSSYGERVGEMWTEFRGVLAAYAGRNPHAEGAIIGAAAATFASFEAWVGGGAR